MYTHSLCTHTYTRTVRQPTISLIHPNGALLNEEISITCTAIVNANIMLMVVDSAGENVSLTDVETTGNSSSVNLRVMSLGRHNITCIADNQGLAEMETGQFDGISKQYSYMYPPSPLPHQPGR